MNIDIIKANYLDGQQANDIAVLMNAYAIDPMGGGKLLPKIVTKNLANELAKRPYAFSIIAYVDGSAAGLVTCFEMFSTFSCKPLINIHDVIVLKEYRGYRLSYKMLEKVEEIALAKGCCKITLEVLEGNKIARASYNKFGFSDYMLDPQMGKALFWQKVLKNI
jgi:GNAT superfamily N-acetyltransferase